MSCAALGEALLESELFGHEAGAFEGAEQRRIGAFERAAGGTLYLDEVGRLPPPCRSRCCGCCRRRRWSGWAGASRWRWTCGWWPGRSTSLAEEIHAGRFRDDLYYRLNVVSLQLPPLRERKADIPALVVALPRPPRPRRGAAGART